MGVVNNYGGQWVGREEKVLPVRTSFREVFIPRVAKKATVSDSTEYETRGKSEIVGDHPLALRGILPGPRGCLTLTGRGSFYWC